MEMDDHGLSERNKQIYEKTTSLYEGKIYLDPAEIKLIETFSGNWHNIKMLDIGIGTGRTTAIFSHICKEYVGIDYSANMIAEARESIKLNSCAKILCGDAKNLSNFSDDYFDVVQFSFNGIDSMGHADRLCVLREIRKKIAPNGVFLFSAHCMLSFAAAKMIAENPEYNNVNIDEKYPLKSANEFVKRNPDIDIKRALSNGWCFLNDLTYHRFYYVLPTKQDSQLNEANFRLESVIDRQGNKVDFSQLNRDNFVRKRHSWLFYFARPVAPS